MPIQAICDGIVVGSGATQAAARRDARKRGADGVLSFQDAYEKKKKPRAYQPENKRVAAGRIRRNLRIAYEIDEKLRILAAHPAYKACNVASMVELLVEGCWLTLLHCNKWPLDLLDLSTGAREK